MLHRSSVILAALALAGGLYGFATSSIPAPEDVSVFWAGNFCAPWLVLSFVAGWAQLGWGWAIITGATTDVACVFGFYARFLTLDPAELGLPAATPDLTVAATSLRHWVVFIAPWVVLAVGAGAVYGALGHRWGRSRSIVAGVSLSVPFLTETWLWPVRLGYFQGPLAIWGAEVIVGIAILAWVLAVWRRSQSQRAMSA